MTELKTLKDIRVLWNSEQSPEAYAVLQDIRLEAIKWIKDIRENLDYNIPNKCKDTIGLICWIKHFFNITEEDLL